MSNYLKPKIYIETRWEKRDGFSFLQPVEYCNNIKFTISNFEKIFNVPFSVVKKESDMYKNTIEDSNYNSKLWKNTDIKNKAFSKIYDFNISGKSGSISSTTPLFPFEIYMINDGFEIISFCELNAINPGLTIIADTFINNALVNPKGIQYRRSYKKDDNFIHLGFGIEINERKVNFYFKTSKSVFTFQVDNNFNNYEKAINGKLKPLE